MLTTSNATTDNAFGWYFYGITRSGSLATVLEESEGEPLQLLESSGISAVVRQVPLADFSQAVMRERLQSASDLEAIVRSHHRVIEAIHAQQAILPAKFGMVYAHAGEIVSALQSERETLLPQLERLEGCDEWALHLYANRAPVRDRIAASDPTIRLWRDELASARPGRAYLLERQLSRALEGATRQELTAVAQTAFDRLSRFAVAGQVTPVGPLEGEDDEVEILRAAFLVGRESVELFAAQVRAMMDSYGLRFESNGPWPPYSFAARYDEEAH